MLVLFTPLSNPVSETVTIIPVPSSAFHAELIPAICVAFLSIVASITPSATSFRVFLSNLGSIHSTSGWSTNQFTPLILTSTVAQRQLCDKTSTSPLLSIPSGSVSPDNTRLTIPSPLVINQESISPFREGIRSGWSFAEEGITAIPLTLSFASSLGVCPLNSQ